jgi:galactokinase
VPARSSAAFAPGRVNIIGEHTDYNDGLALPFAISAGVTVRARASNDEARVIQVLALEFEESDEFAAAAPAPADGWRAFTRGVVSELAALGLAVPGAVVEIAADLPAGSGLSSSAALTVALCKALEELARTGDEPRMEAIAIARLGARVEARWAGAETGLLDQLASLHGAPDTALRIDFSTLSVEPVPLALAGWQFVLLDSGERHSHGSSGYNARREECREACRLLGVGSLRETDRERASTLPEPLDRRVAHVLGENERVDRAVASLESGDLSTLAALLNASHASLRDLYEISTPAVEQTVSRLRAAGAVGARILGGGFGGAVRGLLAPGVQPLPDALPVAPGAGAHLLTPEA